MLAIREDRATTDSVLALAHSHMLRAIIDVIGESMSANNDEQYRAYTTAPGALASILASCWIVGTLILILFDLGETTTARISGVGAVAAFAGYKLYERAYYKERSDRR